MKTIKSSARLGLYVRSENKDGFFHVFAYPVTIGLTQGEMRQIDNGERDTPRADINHDTVRNCSDSYGELQNGLNLSGLSVYSQGNGDRNPREIYGWEVCYKEVFTIDLAKAQKMAKTLDRIHKHMERQTRTNGRPVTYGQYLLHVAKAIGATKMVFAQNGDDTRYSSYSDRNHRFTDLAMGADTVDAMVRNWVEFPNQYQGSTAQ